MTITVTSPPSGMNFSTAWGYNGQIQQYNISWSDSTANTNKYDQFTIKVSDTVTNTVTYSHTYPTGQLYSGTFSVPVSGHAIQISVLKQLQTDGTFIVGYVTGTSPAQVYPPGSGLVSPANNSTLPSGSVTFSWTVPPQGTVSYYDVEVYSGSTSYALSRNSTATSITVSNLPQDGRIISLFVQPYFTDGGTGGSFTATYTAFLYVGYETITAPASGTVLGTSATFSWAPVSAVSNGYTVVIRDATGVYPSTYYNQVTSGTSVTVNGIKQDGRSVSITVTANVPANYPSPTVTQTYTTGLSTISLTTPPPNSAFTGPTMTFSWTAVQGATSYQLDCGTATLPTTYGSSTTTATTLIVSGLPTDGSTVVVRVTASVPGQAPTSSQSNYTAAGASTQAPGSPTPLSPVGGVSTSITPLLSWSVPPTNYVPGTTRFTVKLTDSTTNTVLTDISAGTALTAQVNLTEGLVINHTYTWGVAAANGSNISPVVTSTFATVPSSKTTSSEFGIGNDALSGAVALISPVDTGIGLEQASVKTAVVILTQLRGAYPDTYTSKTPGDLYSH